MSCGCQTTSSNCVREPFNANFVRPLTHIRGVDANGCVSYAPATSFAFNVQDTNTLDLTLAAGVISGNVRISGAAGNQVQALADGLFVPAGTGLQVADTNSVDLTLASGVLSANVIISPNTGNQLQLLPNGLYVPPSTFNLTVTDTNTVDLTLAGNNLSANVIVSPNAGNALQVLPNGLYVGPGGYSLSDCAGNPLPVGAQVLTCPSGVLLLNINDQLIASNPPGTALRTLSSKNCPEPANNDYIIIADNAGNVRYTRMSEAVFHRVNPNPIVFPNLPIVTLQPPNTTTGIIDSATFTNPRTCFTSFTKGFVNALLQHSFNQNGSLSIALARIGNLRDVISRIDNYNTPGITNTPLTGHAWRNQTVVSEGFSSERIVDLGIGILPLSTSTFNRELSMQGATNFYYVTVEDWSATFNVFAL